MVEARLLIASPQMRDPFFERAVVLVWHHDEDGAIGVVINRPLSQQLDEVLMPMDEVDVSGHHDNRVTWGGPVETTSGTILTQGEIGDDEGWVLPGGIAVTRSQDALIRLIGEDAPIVLCLGYAGWGAGQLDREIETGGWLVLEVEAELVFDREVEALYERALGRLGLTPSTVWMQPISE